jgi:hypothetical protein
VLFASKHPAGRGSLPCISRSLSLCPCIARQAESCHYCCSTRQSLFHSIKTQTCQRKSRSREWVCEREKSLTHTTYLTIQRFLLGQTNVKIIVTHLTHPANSRHYVLSIDCNCFFSITATLDCSSELSVSLLPLSIAPFLSLYYCVSLLLPLDPLLIPLFTLALPNRFYVFCSTSTRNEDGGRESRYGCGR